MDMAVCMSNYPTHSLTHQNHSINNNNNHNSALVIRAISVLEGIALVGNPSFAIIDEAYPYIARRLMTDRSPRLRAALRYMIYGKDGVFDAENAIDLLQALEKFTAVRDDGDGSAFKVDGVRGSKMVGAAGDFTGSQKVDTTDRDKDARFRITTTTTAPKQSSSIVAVANRQQLQQRETNDDARTIREALKFFFSAEGDVFREFLSEEIVNVVDASGRGVLEEVSRRLGWTSVIPSFLRRASMSDKDRRTVEQLQKLFEFLLGDYEKSVLSSNSSNSARIRKALPVLREFSPQLRDFGLLLAVRLTEKNLGRSMTWATQRLAEADSRRARGLSATVR
jgi:aarF domain-containing kinase